MDSRYEKRGVSADKTDVHAAIAHLDKGLFPRAFCKVLPDFAANDPEMCCIMHADTAGTKTSLAYLYWRETGDLSVWSGIVQDAIVMNLDDMACAGVTDDFILSSTIGRNKHLIPGEVVTRLIQSTSEFIESMARFDVTIHLAGGETADVGDIVRTADVGFTAFARVPRKNIIEINPQPGDVIVGFSSSGQSSYEDFYNAGMGSNGLTAARHDVFEKSYADKYPETFDPKTDPELVYSGSLKLTDVHPETGRTYGQMVLSPTRTYLPLLKKILPAFQEKIHGIVHNTGGGQTKVLKFVDSIHLIKDNLFPIPPLFRMIQEQSGTNYQEMYKVFNMGHRLEIYTDSTTATQLIDLARVLQVDAQIIGRVEAHTSRLLTVTGEWGQFTYTE